MTLLSSIPVQELQESYQRSNLPHVALSTLDDQGADAHEMIDRHLAVTSSIGRMVLLETDRNSNVLQLAVTRVNDIGSKQIEHTERFNKVDGGLEKVEYSLNQVEGGLDNVKNDLSYLKDSVTFLKGEFLNSRAMRQNERRFKLYHRVESIQAYRFNSNLGRCEWVVSPRFPKHLKAFRDLGNHAKGQWTASEKTKLSQSQQIIAQDKALETIRQLLEFYNVSVFNDDKSESDATGVMLDGHNVDDFMEELGDQWGLEWHDIRHIPDEQPNVLADKKRKAGFWERSQAKRREYGGKEG